MEDTVGRVSTKLCTRTTYLFQQLYNNNSKTIVYKYITFLVHVSAFTRPSSGRWLSEERSKVKQSCTGLLQSQSAPGGWGFQIFRQSAHDGGKVVSLTHRLPSLPRKYSWSSFLLGTLSDPGPYCGRKDYVNYKFQWLHRESNPRPPGL
jgi:hypothetical protein